VLYRLKRHPLPIAAHFRHSLVLTYAYPEDLLEPLLPPGLALDAYGEHGFVAVATVQTERLRPSFLPPAVGLDFFLIGYRIFVRVARTPSLRGLYILRSDADRRAMVVLGNLLTHYRYRLADVSCVERNATLEIRVRTPEHEADLHVMADLNSRPAALPEHSPFNDLADARRFAGPLPYTFDYEHPSRSIIAVRAARGNWGPQPIAVEVRQATFFASPPFTAAEPVLTNAFYVGDVDYRWERGRVLAADSLCTGPDPVNR
jgi:Uncharacterized conserved protein (COG2071)